MFKKEKGSSNSRPRQKSGGIGRLLKVFTGKGNKNNKGKKGITGVKKRKKAAAKKRDKKRNRKFKKILKLIQFGFLIILAIIFVIVAVYFSAKLVLKIRDNTQEDGTQNNHSTVYGFKDIPAYPQSTFIFQGQEKNDSVQKFLNKGYSIYRLEPKHDIQDVYKFYQQELPKKGWKNIETVPLESTEKMHGQYWLKKGNGIRIYSRINDIWYQKLSEKDTRNCLSSKVEEEKKRELILSQFNSTSFLPSFPWELELPGEYIITYNVAEQIEKPTHNEFLEDIQKATIQKIGSKDQFILVKPVFIYNGGKLDIYQDRYAEDNFWEIIKSEEYFNNTGRVLKVDYAKKSIEDIKEEFNETSEESSPNDSSDSNQSEQQSKNFPKKKEDIATPPNQALIILHDSIKIVYSIEQHGDDAETKKLFNTVIENIKVSKAEL